MGLNINLHKIFAELPSRFPCPNCGTPVETRFHDYDIECGNPFPEAGKMKLNLYCDECDHDWSLFYKIRLQKDMEIL